MKRNLGQKRLRGFSLLEMAIVLATIGILYSSYYWQWLGTATRTWQNYAVAAHMKDMVEAARRYVARNYASIYTSAAGGVVTITPAMLQAAGDLSPSFSATNLLNQTYAVLARRLPALPAPNDQRLEVLVVAVGGDQLTDIDCAEVTKGLESAGGCIYSTDAANVRGSGGGWATAATNYASAGANAPTLGRPAAMTYFADGGITSSYLNRYNTGNPEDNRMHTAVDMNNNALNNVSSIEIGDQTLQQPQAQMINDLYGDGINGSYGQNLAVEGAFSAAGTVTAAAALNATRGVSLGAVATSGTACSPNGAIAAATDGSGDVLACKNATWQALGGNANVGDWVVQAIGTYQASTDGYLINRCNNGMNNTWSGHIYVDSFNPPTTLRSMNQGYAPVTAALIRRGEYYSGYCSGGGLFYWRALGT